MTSEAGWYDHADGGTLLRWWDGEGWTDQFAPRADDVDTAPAYGPDAAYAAAPDVYGQPHPDEAVVNVYAYDATPTVNPGLRWGTVSVWLLAFSPWLTMVSVIAAFWSAVAISETSYYWVLILLVPHALTAGLAVLDSRRLREWQHPRVPHWAWSVLGAPAYLIARAVVLRGNTIRGSVPLWVALANIVLGWLAVTVGLFALGAFIVWVIGMLSDSMSGVN
ncbi:DUF2510 domain-containing protein [Cryobacterium sp. AP23]